MSRAKKKQKFQDEVPPPVEAINEPQQEYLEAIRDYQQVFGIGPAGTGKTFIPAAVGADKLMRRETAGVVITRPNVPAGRSLGFFPGELEEKMAPWVAPITSVMKERMGDKFDYDWNKGNIEVVPFEVMRGRSLYDKFVILDEAQNTTKSEMEMFLTRIGEHSKVIVTGDLDQSDLREQNGLDHAIELAETYGLPTPIIEFQISDIVRSGLCAQWTKAYLRDADAD